ncbi:SdiA-regulated domain-containing protein [Aquimarina mytili]|uniref:SdiA-regulated domain-containing protein n=1 Tax=Aquimarina mytili TaxID=874423 RepID=A0A936ZV95_9FLAO|nr:SdiA-regulated domain-containing protein [Aquimarina mytili]MBL0686027.1 SdiA-regulated domain-containing protein [Aquimarina mytili]
MPGIREIKISHISYLILLLTMTASCQKKKDSNLVKINSLPNAIHEISGITLLHNTILYAINDSGNDNTLFELNERGKIMREIKIQDAKNIDWEDLAYDQNNNIYIGDFGNNTNKRKDLVIYKVSDVSTSKVTIDKIKFSYEDQHKFPPKKKNLNYDVEAFVYLNDNLYLFSKNRSSKFNGETKLYKIPAKAGNHTAKLIDTFVLCEDSKDCFVTAATVNKEGNKIALLTYNKLFIFSDFTEDDFFGGAIKKIKLNHYSQKEGVCFKNDSTLYITDEKQGKKKASLYQYRIQ